MTRSTEAEGSSAATSQDRSVCTVRQLRHRYGETEAICGIDLEVRSGETVAILGPNGSGKTTLFRVLSTLTPVQSGTIQMDGRSVAESPLEIRGKIGVIFQAPSLDKKLTVDENIAFQGALYGISGDELNDRRQAVLEQFDLVDRRSDFCEQLSGGLKRRVELAKGMLHSPKLLLLDEPSTGLDPAARLQLWKVLQSMRDSGTSVLMTTHLLDEAEKADRVVIMDRGKIIADGPPAQLRRGLGQGVISLKTTAADRVAAAVKAIAGDRLIVSAGDVRFVADDAADLVSGIAKELDRHGVSELVQSIVVGPPSLEDVFIERTGQEFHGDR